MDNDAITKFQHRVNDDHELKTIVDQILNRPTIDWNELLKIAQNYGFQLSIEQLQNQFGNKVQMSKDQNDDPPKWASMSLHHENYYEDMGTNEWTESSSDGDW